MRPNNSFKPKPLRYTKGMAEKACHAFGSTTRFGLTQALGRKEQRQAGAVAPDLSAHRVAHHPWASACCPPRGTAPPFGPRLRVLCRRPCSGLAGIVGQALASAGFRRTARRRASAFLASGASEQKACVPLPVVACCGLTIHSSRTRFAGRLNSGV